MRILLTTYHQAFLTPAGGETELQQLAEFMSDCGARADIYGPNSRRLSYYDAVVHFSSHGGGENLLADIKAGGKPIVLIPNFNFFDQNHGSNGIVQRHLDFADLVILRTEVEKNLCENNFNIPSRRLVVIPPGIPSIFYKPAERGLFQSAYGVDRYVLWVGQLAQHKRQLEAIKALKGLSVPLVLIGGYSDKLYFDQCRAAADENVRFLPHVLPASEILRSALQDCSAYLELGDDHPGFSAIEAAVTGASMVLNDHPWSREILGSAPLYVANSAWDGLREKVEGALQKERQPDLATLTRNNYLQPKVTAHLLQHIESLISQR